MQLMILDKEETLPEELLKLQEEVKEIKEAILNKDTENTTEEILDVIQVCIGMLDTQVKTKDMQKAKRMKKLNKLGIGYIETRKIMKIFSLEEVDVIIEQINKIKETNVLKKIEKAFRRFINFVLEFEKVEK